MLPSQAPPQPPLPVAGERAGSKGMRTVEPAQHVDELARGSAADLALVVWVQES